MNGSDWIATGALVVAVLGWLDSRRTIRKQEERIEKQERSAAVRIQMEINDPTREERRFRLRNIGTEKVWSLRIDPESVLYHETSGLTYSNLKSGEATFPFMIAPRSVVNDYPDTVEVRWDKPFPGSQLVAVPDAPENDESKSTEPTQ